MSPQEKAKELFERFENATYNYFTMTGDGVEVVMLAKQSALIAVDEAEKSENNVLTKFGFVTQNYTSDYWKLVKDEIERF